MADTGAVRVMSGTGESKWRKRKFFVNYGTSDHKRGEGPQSKKSSFVVLGVLGDSVVS